MTTLYVNDANTGALTPINITNDIAVKDAGPLYPSLFSGIKSTDLTTAQNVSVAPNSGERLVITDIIITSDVSLRCDFLEETTGIFMGAAHITASGVTQVSPRGKWKLPTVDKRLQCKTSKVGDVRIITLCYSEA